MSFKSVQKKIAGEGHSMESAGAILANASRNASASAKKKNPKLKRVKGGNSIAGPMKAKGLTEGPKHNHAAKESFKTTDARPAGKPNQNESLRSAREHNLAAKDMFCDCE